MGQWHDHPGRDVSVPEPVVRLRPNRWGFADMNRGRMLETISRKRPLPLARPMQDVRGSESIRTVGASVTDSSKTEAATLLGAPLPVGLETCPDCFLAEALMAEWSEPLQKIWPCITPSSYTA